MTLLYPIIIFWNIQGVRFNLDDNTVSFQSSQMELSKNEAKILRLLMEKEGDDCISRSFDGIFVEDGFLCG